MEGYNNQSSSARRPSFGHTNATASGRYVYCILRGEQNIACDNIGINDLPVYTIWQDGVTAAVSDVQYTNSDPNLDQVKAHERVISELRQRFEVILPVRFGVIIKGEEGVKKLLHNSGQAYKEKMEELIGRDEYGVRVMLAKEDAINFRRLVEAESEAVQKLKQEIDTARMQGRSYFLKMKLNDMIKVESIRRIEAVAGRIHHELTAVTDKSVMLNSDVDQLVLNSSFLVKRESLATFQAKVEELKNEHKKMGFSIYVSGPWAPYSFC